jgi:hypothetical protein
MPKTISFSAKCSDLFSAQLKDETGKLIGEYEGYVPDFLGTWGDYVELTVDIESGKILNWKKPTQKDLTIFKAES